MKNIGHNYLSCAYLDGTGDGSLLLSLNGIKDDLKHHVFQGHHYGPVRSNRLFSGDRLSLYDVVVLPGSAGENSPYPLILNDEAVRKLKSALEDGLVLITFCAASYYMLDNIFYQTRDGQIKIAKGLGLIEGAAKQAFHSKTRQDGKADLYRDYIEARLTSPHFDKPIHILNVNGPSFHLSEREKSLTDIFLNYADIDGAAGLIKRIGKGMIIALGVHPELSSSNSDRHGVLTFPRHDADRMHVLSLLRQLVLSHFSLENVPAPQVALTVG